jgi:hypothetical protein
MTPKRIVVIAVHMVLCKMALRVAKGAGIDSHVGKIPPCQRSHAVDLGLEDGAGVTAPRRSTKIQCFWFSPFPRRFYIEITAVNKMAVFRLSSLLIGCGRLRSANGMEQES